MSNHSIESQTDHFPRTVRQDRREAVVPGVSISDRIRRVMDIVLASVALVVFAPLMIAIAVIIKLDSPGPVLFRHVRVGRNRRFGVPTSEQRERRKVDSGGPGFVFYKYRTMYADAKERFPELYTYDYTPEELAVLPIKVLVGKKGDLAEFSDGPKPELMDDPRVTRVGRWLRRTSLDELPNFLNVLTGEMSLVGPRPDIADNVVYYWPSEMKKFSVKPGITGLAQVKGRGFLPFHDINAYDVEYVDKRSLWLDVQILFWTAVHVVRRHGAF